MELRVVTPRLAPDLAQRREMLRLRAALMPDGVLVRLLGLAVPAAGHQCITGHADLKSIHFFSSLIFRYFANATAFINSSRPTVLSLFVWISLTIIAR